MSKREKRGPRGMTKRTRMIKAGPPKPPPALGDVVWYSDACGASHTGRFIRVVGRGKGFGLCIIEDSVTGGKREVLPERIEKA